MPLEKRAGRDQIQWHITLAPKLNGDNTKETAMTNTNLMLRLCSPHQRTTNQLPPFALCSSNLSNA
ncbi:hypothetical protein LNL84_19640, partial [Vibrio sp. ZSDZ34]